MSSCRGCPVDNIVRVRLHIFSQAVKLTTLHISSSLLYAMKKHVHVESADSVIGKGFHIGVNLVFLIASYLGLPLYETKYPQSSYIYILKTHLSPFHRGHLVFKNLLAVGGYPFGFHGQGVFEMFGHGVRNRHKKRYWAVVPYNYLHVIFSTKA